MDSEILSTLSTKEAYDTYARFVKPSSLGEEAWDVFTAMGDYFSVTPSTTSIDWGAFKAWMSLVRFAKMDKTKLDSRKTLVDVVAKIPAGVDMSALLNGLAKRDYAAQIADVALKITDGDFKLSFTDIEGLIEQHDYAVGKIDKLTASVGEFTVDSLEAASAPGLKWRMKCLNESLGDLRKGDFIVLGKRPDTGGTTFLASESTFMAQQLPEDSTVLWVNNEEEGNKVRRRIVQSGIGATSAAMNADMKRAFTSYTALMGGRKDKIVVYDNAHVHIKDVNTLLEKYKPGLVIFDQLWKVHGFDKEAGTEVVRQTMLFQWAREVAKQYAPVITVHQADGTASNTKWIEMNQLYNSKTGIQGEADAIITIGRLPEEGDTRYFYVPKNKLQGSDPTKRNLREEVTILPEVARFKEW